MSDQLAYYAEVIQDLQNRLAAAEEEAKNFAQMYADMATNAGKLQQRCADLERAKNAAETELNHIHAVAPLLESQLAAAEEKYQTVNGVISKLRDQLATSEERVRELEARLPTDYSPEVVKVMLAEATRAAYERAAEIAEIKGMNQNESDRWLYKYGRDMANGIAAAIRAEMEKL